MRAAALVFAAGCSYSAPNTPIDGAPPPPPDGVDAPIDTTPVDPDNCYGTSTFVVCLTEAPGSPLTLGTQTYDSTTCSGGVATGGPTSAGLCVRSGTDVVIDGNTFRAEGTQPLVIVASGDLTVAPGAYLDVSSFDGIPRAAGANFAGCTVASEAGNDNNGGAGGAGGSFGSVGGAGGNGPGSATAGTPGPADPTPTALRGGCPGSNGGAGMGVGGIGGASGGAVYLVAGGTVVVDGTIDASGEGGRGGPAGKNGGGGGGSGGMILLHGKLGVTIGSGAQLFANGAGGGGGAAAAAGGDGVESTGVDVQGGGGPSGGSGATAGGAGAIGMQTGGTASPASKGAGGGGGGVGVILDLSGS